MKKEARLSIREWKWKGCLSELQSLLCRWAWGMLARKPPPPILKSLRLSKFQVFSVQFICQRGCARPSSLRLWLSFPVPVAVGSQSIMYHPHWQQRSTKKHSSAFYQFCASLEQGCSFMCFVHVFWILIGVIPTWWPKISSLLRCVAALPGLHDSQDQKAKPICNNCSVSL